MENQNLNQAAGMPQPPMFLPEVESDEPLEKEYRPSNRELLKNYPINIDFLDRGCIVRIGCKSIAFESVEQAMNEINKYVANPYDMEKEWRKILDA
jgi:hypothetical protein